MCNYRLIALDIDGTLLTSNHNITSVTKRAIVQATKLKIPVVISTGRAISGVEGIINELELDLPFITYNGAMIVLGKSREILYEQKLSQEDATTIYQLGEHLGTTIILWNNNTLYVNRLDERAKEYAQLANTDPIVIDDVCEIIQDGATKLLFYDDVETIRHFEAVASNKLGNTINFHTSKPFFLEFVDARASKALALERLGKKLGIKRHEMIAVGDGFNDLSMIKYAGLGVAMGNANKLIKEASDYVTYTNDEDGVAHVIKQFILCKNPPTNQK